MKKIILAMLLISVVVLPHSLSANMFDNWQSRQDNRRWSNQKPRYRSDYRIDDWAVYYRGQKIQGADEDSFRDLGDGYAKDKWWTYYCGKKMIGGDSDTFRYLGDDYAVDKWRVYYLGKTMQGANEDSFRILGGGYAKDKWRVFYEGQNLNNADTDTFEYDARSDYAQDRLNIYYRGEITKDYGYADRRPENLGGNYTCDGRSVYYGNKKLRDADASSFDYLGGGYAKDYRRVFYEGRIMRDADAESFRYDRRSDLAQDRWNTYRGGRVTKNKDNDCDHHPIDSRHRDYIVDANAVYYKNKKIKGASANTFQILSEDYAKDAWTVFFRGEKIDASAMTFQYEGDGYAKDAWNRYYMGKKL